MRVLLLGGTTGASRLAALLAAHPRIQATLSLAGRTAAPVLGPLPTRVGGFGGAEGLAAHLRAEGVGTVVDATHPFAAVISRNATLACATAGVPLLALRRPPWTPGPGDRWTEVAGMLDAVRALGEAPRRVFLTVGRLELAPFAAAPQHAYLVRTIEPLGDALPVPHLRRVQGRGPFALAEEEALMAREEVEVLVTKNSGGAATAPKLAAARALGLPVVLVAPPAKPAGEAVTRPEDALAWLEAHAGTP